jgi:hypothetical protein
MRRTHGGYAFISARFGDEEFDEISMNLGDLIEFVEDARMHGVPLNARLVGFPHVNSIHQLAFIYLPER